MTPRERAKQVVIEAKNRGEVKVAANGAFRERIAQSIVAAVEAEREACAQICDEIAQAEAATAEKFKQSGEEIPRAQHVIMCVFVGRIAKSIRARTEAKK